MKLKNNTSGPKAIPTANGVVILAAGAEQDIDGVSDADAKAIKASGMLDKDGTVPSLADLQRQIASSPIGSLETDRAEAERAERPARRTAAAEADKE